MSLTEAAHDLVFCQLVSGEKTLKENSTRSETAHECDTAHMRPEYEIIYENAHTRRWSSATGTCTYATIDKLETRVQDYFGRVGNPNKTILTQCWSLRLLMRLHEITSSYAKMICSYATIPTACVPEIGLRTSTRVFMRLHR